MSFRIYPIIFKLINQQIINQYYPYQYILLTHLSKTSVFTLYSIDCPWHKNSQFILLNDYICIMLHYITIQYNQTNLDWIIRTYLTSFNPKKKKNQGKQKGEFWCLNFNPRMCQHAFEYRSCKRKQIFINTKLIAIPAIGNPEYPPGQ